MPGTPSEEFPIPRGPKPTPIALAGDERARRAGRARRPTRAQRLAPGAKVAQAAADGHPNAAAAADPRVTAPTVRGCRGRFPARRPDGLVDGPRPGAPRAVADERAEPAATRTREPEPANTTRRSTRTLAGEPGLWQTAVGRIWHPLGLKPDRRSSFELSADPPPVGKVRDIVGLDPAPPERAAVPRVDEESQIPAVDRTQPI